MSSSHVQTTANTHSPLQPHPQQQTAPLPVSSSTTSTGETGTLITDPVPPQQPHQHHEDRLSRTWRSLGSSVVLATTKAEQASKEPTKSSLKEVDEAVVGFLRTRLEWGRLVSYLEAKLEGTVKEMETIQHYVRCQPKAGNLLVNRKRKTRVEDEREELQIRAMNTVVAEHSASSTPHCAAADDDDNGKNDLVQLPSAIESRTLTDSQDVVSDAIPVGRQSSSPPVPSLLSGGSTGGTMPSSNQHGTAATSITAETTTTTTVHAMSSSIHNLDDENDETADDFNVTFDFTTGAF